MRRSSSCAVSTGLRTSDLDRLDVAGATVVQHLRHRDASGYS